MSPPGGTITRGATATAPRSRIGERRTVSTHTHAGPRNALQALIDEHMDATGDTLSDIAARGGLSRQTVSGVYNRMESGGVPRRSTLQKLATGLGLSLAVVADAAARSAGVDGAAPTPLDGRLAVLVDTARSLDPNGVDVLLATARALRRNLGDTPTNGD